MCAFCVGYFVSASSRRKLGLPTHVLLVLLQTDAHIDSNFEVSVPLIINTVVYVHTGTCLRYSYFQLLMQAVP